MRTTDLTQLLAAEEALRPYITDPSISVAAVALKVVNAFLDASPEKKRRKQPSKEIVDESDVVMISLATNDPGIFYSVRQSQVLQFQAHYPAVDVQQHLRNMAAWLMNNKRNAKTLAGMPRFINAWLAKEQNRSTPNGNGRHSNNDNWLAGAADLAAELRSNGK